MPVMSPVIMPPSATSERVKVYCRLRPGTERERRDGLAAQPNADGTAVLLTPPEQATHVRPGEKAWEFETLPVRCAFKVCLDRCSFSLGYHSIYSA